MQRRSIRDRNCRRHVQAPARCKSVLIHCRRPNVSMQEAVMAARHKLVEAQTGLQHQRWKIIARGVKTLANPNMQSRLRSYWMSISGRRSFCRPQSTDALRQPDEHDGHQCTKPQGVCGVCAAGQAAELQNRFSVNLVGPSMCSATFAV